MLFLNLIQGEPTSPHPSIDRLSVTFAISGSDQQQLQEQQNRENDEYDDDGADETRIGGRCQSTPAAESCTSFDFHPPRRRTLTLDNSFGYRSPDMLRGSILHGINFINFNRYYKLFYLKEVADLRAERINRLITEMTSFSKTKLRIIKKLVLVFILGPK